MAGGRAPVVRSSALWFVEPLQSSQQSKRSSILAMVRAPANGGEGISRSSSVPRLVFFWAVEGASLEMCLHCAHVELEPPGTLETAERDEAHDAVREACVKPE